MNNKNSQKKIYRKKIKKKERKIQHVFEKLDKYSAKCKTRIRAVSHITHTHVSYARNELLNTPLGIFLIRNAFHTRWPENIHVGCLCESFSQRLFLRFLFDFSIDSSNNDEQPTLSMCHFVLQNFHVSFSFAGNCPYVRTS